MGSATIRRFAFVAALLLLAPISCRASVVVRAAESYGVLVVGLTPSGGSAAPALRRHTSTGWWMAASRADHGRGLVAVGVVALLSLLTPARWSPLAAVRSARSPLTRRRHVIALRGPPLHFA